MKVKDLPITPQPFDVEFNKGTSPYFIDIFERRTLWKSDYGLVRLFGVQAFEPRSNGTFKPLSERFTVARFKDVESAVLWKLTFL